MKRSFAKLGLALLMAAAGIAFAQEGRRPWAEVAAPEITSVALDPDDSTQVLVQFNLDTPRDGSGADKGQVVVSGAGSTTVEVGSTRRAEKSATFVPKKSGTYTITVYGIRNEEEEKKASKPVDFEFKFPLAKPAPLMLNSGKGSVAVSWSEVNEAEGYVVSYTGAGGQRESLPQTTELSAEITGLSVGQFYDISVAAIRGNEAVYSDTTHKLIKDEVEREWNFAWFGTSTSAETNTYKVIDPNNLTLQLSSCTFDPDTQGIIKKGGKFTAYFDGVSFYYTVLDPRKENFDLKATVTIDYENPATDGQEGFAVYALDRIGVHKSTTAYPTNSAGIVSTKYTTHINGAKKEIKNGVGARFVTGITPTVLEMGDEGIPLYATSKGEAYSYDQNSDKVRTGRVYNVELKKDNTGYHAILVPDVASEDTVSEYILYDVDNTKLLQLDTDQIYVGFAVARGTVATFSNISFTTSDPKTDPPAEEAPPELLPLANVIDSPTTYYSPKYPFVFRSNSDGNITVTDTKTGKTLISNAKVRANVDFTKRLKFKISWSDRMANVRAAKGFFAKIGAFFANSGQRDLHIEFKPTDGYKPLPNTVIAQYNRETEQYEQDYKTVSITHTVIYKKYKGKKLYASPDGTVFGTATRESPLDLNSAVSYAAPGQQIIMLKGTYYPDKALIIERGNNGTKGKRKVLMSESAAEGERAVLNFSRSSSKTQALITWGNYWTFKDFDVCNTLENVKGFQIAGSHNIIEGVNAYLNGDTGIQISGQASETFEKWPAHNLVLNCTSYGNCDPAENNADGFAAKLTVADGNVFRGCIAYSNIDDGWDLFAKIESGPIGAVLVENCIAFRNGTRLDGTGNGDGNGFKMGGEGIDVHHVLRNSISFDNTLNGVTSNSNPGLYVENVTSFGNLGYNIALYGKSKTAPLTCKASGVISANGGKGDLGDMQSMGAVGEEKLKELTTEDNYFFFGSKPINSKSEELKPEEIFKSIDTKSYEAARKPDGSIDMQGVLELTDKAPKKSGARF